MSADIGALSNLDFCFHCLDEAEKEMKQGVTYSSWRPQRTLLGSWGQIGLKAFGIASSKLSQSETLLLQKRILSSPLWKEESYSHTDYSLTLLSHFDEVLSHCITITKNPPQREDIAMLLKQGLWKSATSCLNFDIDFPTFPWEMVWHRGDWSSKISVSAPNQISFHQSHDHFLERINTLVSQYKAPISFLAYIPPSHLKKLIDHKNVNPERLLTMIEKDPSLKMLPSNALLITEHCIALWDKTNPEKTREKVREWSLSHPSLIQTCKFIPTAYYKDDKGTFDQWHWGLLSNWRQIMSSYKIGRRIDIVDTFKNVPVSQGDMNTLKSYMEMAQVRPSPSQLRVAVSLKDFWSSALLFQSLNTNPASVASFWISCTRPPFFRNVSPSIQQRVEKEILNLALIPKEKMSDDLRSIRPFVAGAYQYLLYQKKELTYQDACHTWVFLQNYPTIANQQPVVAKIIQSIKNGIFSVPEKELSQYLDKTSLDEKTKLELSTAYASFASSPKAKMKM